MFRICFLGNMLTWKGFAKPSLSTKFSKFFIKGSKSNYFLLFLRSRQMVNHTWHWLSPVNTIAYFKFTKRKLMPKGRKWLVSSISCNLPCFTYSLRIFTFANDGLMITVSHTCASFNKNYFYSSGKGSPSICPSSMEYCLNRGVGIS